MSYRLKNSDFRPFLGVLDGKVRDLGAYVGEDTEIYFGVFLSRESIPGEGVSWRNRENMIFTD